MSQSFIKEALLNSKNCLETFLSNEQNLDLIARAIEAFVQTLKNDGRILACGNGGSMCDSLHFVEELTGRYRKDRRPLAAMGMGDGSHITCVGNDFGFSEIFSRNVEAWGRSGDSLLAISTSGNSENVVKAVNMAKDKNIVVIGLLGKGGGKLKDLVDIPIIVDHNVTDRIQEIHIKLIHIFIEGIERQLFPEHY